MTIKQNGGIFGRNPTFNNVTVEGEFTSSSLNIDSNKLYVDPNNVRVGINTDSPDTIFEIRGSDPILTIRDTDTGSATANATLRLAETGASDTLDSYWDIKATNGFLHFIDNWNEGGGTGTRISFLDGGGIAFNGDTSSDNALSDYEQGSFTPTITSAGTAPTVAYNSQTGAYTKIGNRVHVDIYISTSAYTAGTGNFRIAGLPFTAASVAAEGGAAPMGFKVDTGAEARLKVEGGDTVCQMFSRGTRDTSTGWGNAQSSIWGTANPTILTVSFTYVAA
jgi:hypothetical protein